MSIRYDASTYRYVRMFLIRPTSAVQIMAATQEDLDEVVRIMSRPDERSIFNDQRAMDSLSTLRNRGYSAEEVVEAIRQLDREAKP